MKAATARDLALDMAGRIDGPGPVGVKRFFAGVALVADGAAPDDVLEDADELRAWAARAYRAALAARGDDLPGQRRKGSVRERRR